MIMLFCISPSNPKTTNLLDNLELVHEPENTARSSGEFLQRSVSATDLDITELAPQNTHHVASEDADVKGFPLFFLNLTFIHIC